MERLICAVCRDPVPGREGSCDRCDSLLSLPGAVQVVRDPAPSGTDAGDGWQATSSPAGSPAEEGASPPTDDGLCSTPGCTNLALPNTGGLCGHCLLHPPAGGRTAARTFRLLAPWSEVIELPEGCSVGLGRDPAFSDQAHHLASSVYVSRAHVFLKVQDGRLFVSDRDSHNGTAKNGDRLTAYEEVPLDVNDMLTLGGQETFLVLGS